MNDFLTNDICRFKILNNEHLIKNEINVAVSSFFKRDQYYKNFGIYVKGLQKVLNYFEKKVDFTYMLFIDENIKNDNHIMQMIKKCSNCIPILFTCSKYMKNNYHYDLFGTLVRFFPMFNFDNNPCNMVICIDIDLHDDDYFRLDSITKNHFPGVVGAGTIAEFIMKKETTNIQNYSQPYIFAGLLSYNIPKSDNFLIVDYIKNIDKITSTGHYGKRLTPFGFGVDEIFINDILLPKIGSIGVIIDYQISYFMFHSKDQIMNHPLSSKILSTIMGKYDNKNFTVKQKYDFIDKNTYQIRENNNINKVLAKRFSKVIKYLYTNKLKWMNTYLIKFIHKYLLNLISANLVINYDYNVRNITDVKLYDVI